jgi:hypothetical protein
VTLPVLEEELLAGIEETAYAMNANLKKRVERISSILLQAVREVRRKKTLMTKGFIALLLLRLMGPIERPTDAFTAYDCTHRINIVELYLLLEPDACAVTDGKGEVETVVCREIVQMKQDRIILIFRCQVI